MLAAAFTMTRGLAPATGVPDDVAVGVGIGVGVAVAERVGVGVGEGVPDPACVGVAVGVGVADAPGVGVGVAEPEGVDSVAPMRETTGGVPPVVPPPPQAASPTPAANAKPKTSCDRRGIIDERVRLDVNRAPRLGM
jgi:hypothetical protein